MVKREFSERGGDMTRLAGCYFNSILILSCTNKFPF